MKRLVLVVLLVLAGCQTPAGYRADDPTVPPSPHAALRWKAILLAGDSSIVAFDNATRDVAKLLESRGVQVVRTYTADAKKVSATTELATHENLRKLPATFKAARGEGCLLYATSHGTVHGLRLPADRRQNILTPATLKQIVGDACGDAPTVMVVSACHSGTFIRESTTGPAVIMLTAATESRKSFGCRAERRYTYYDGCFLTEFPRARTWQDLHRRMLSCIEAKEAGQKELASEPQAWFGRKMKDLPLPGAR